VVLQFFYDIRRDSVSTPVDALVNAANPQMGGGGGICGAIWGSYGPGGWSAAPSYRQWKVRGRDLKPGEVLAHESADGMGAVLQALGPDCRGKLAGGLPRQSERKALRDAYVHLVEESLRLGARSLILCNISAAIYAYPKNLAAAIAVPATVDTFMERLREMEIQPDRSIGEPPVRMIIEFNQFDAGSERFYRQQFEELRSRPAQ
jgi:O-acetyl-ADP-ribose deacetylase (regulator of RNase III)